MDQLEAYIVSIYDENYNEIMFSSLKIEYVKSKRSSTYSKILVVDGNPITGRKRNTYKVKFKCNCGNYSEVALKYFLSKNIVQCNKCLNRIKQKSKRTKLEFDEYSNEFKEKYWDRHLHSFELEKCIDKLVTINHKNFDKENLVYYEHLVSNNQSHFQSYISFDKGLTKEPLKSLEIQCSICGEVFSIHPFNIRLQDIYNIKCRKCKFNTKIFEVKKYNESLTYQSLPELKFIELCISNGIEIMNGFEIPYRFDKKDKTYITDFYLPEYKYIIEIKARNIFYKNDLITGKAQAKAAGACNFGKKHGMKYKLVFDTNIESFVNLLKTKRTLTIL